MLRKILKYITIICIFVVGLIVGHNHISCIKFLDNPFCHEVNFIVSVLTVVGILFYWGTTISKRVMHKDIKRYIIIVVGLQIFWLTIRTMKWSAFEFGKNIGRFLWYMFYIPMLLIPSFLLFIALSVSNDEAKRLNKKWYLLFIPAILLLILVLTNDFHQLVFEFKSNFENWDMEYSYGHLYPIVMIFMVMTIIVAIITLFHKWRRMNKTKGRCLIIFVSGLAISYFTTYIVNRPFIGAIIDITVFGCMINVLFLESCIVIGLIRSNSRHQEIFAKADIDAQILDNHGETRFQSIGNSDISKIDFMTLIENKQLIKNENTLLHLEPIRGGYVTWNSDITDINKTIKEIEISNKGLYNEVELLKRANEQKRERFSTEKQSAIQDIIFSEIKPIIEQIKCLILQSENALPEVKKRCLCRCQYQNA